MTAQGRHKIYLGMAAGVGKTMRSLAEIRDLRLAGVDAIIGILETHNRQDTAKAAEGLPIFPRRTHHYKGTVLTDLDVVGILERRPEWVLVDELAHSNIPESLHPKRFMDVEDLLAGGINVISTLNIQHLESLNDEVARLTKVRVRERVPDKVVLEADEVVIVDITPEALRERLQAGKIYAADKVEQSLQSFFTAENLAVLRELALRRTADVVEEEPISPTEGRGVKERIVVAVRAEAHDARLIRRGARVVQRFKGDLLVVHIKNKHHTPEQFARLNEHEALAREFGAGFTVLSGQDIAGSLVEFLRDEHATQVILGESHRPKWREVLSGSVVLEILRRSNGIDVYIIADE
jgi:two-component system, OmpR family, sensor histidine kinase KdpD